MASPELSVDPLRPLLEHLVQDRVEATLNKLLISHRNGSITAQEALSGVATISSLRLLLSDLDARLKPKK